MKQKLLNIAARLRAKADHIGDEGLRDIAKELEDLAGTVVTSDKSSSNETNDDGGIEVPKKPPPP